MIYPRRVSGLLAAALNLRRRYLYAIARIKRLTSFSVLTVNFYDKVLRGGANIKMVLKERINSSAVRYAVIFTAVVVYIQAGYIHCCISVCAAKCSVAILGIGCAECFVVHSVNFPLTAYAVLLNDCPNAYLCV